MYKCPICPQIDEYKNLVGLLIHWQKIHKSNSESLYILLYGRKFCSCGCQRPTTYISITKGYSKYVHNHHVRVCGNSHLHNKENYEKISKSRRKRFSSGEETVWNKGLTKNTDDRVKLYGKKISQNIPFKH